MISSMNRVFGCSLFLFIVLAAPLFASGQTPSLLSMPGAPSSGNPSPSPINVDGQGASSPFDLNSQQVGAEAQLEEIGGITSSDPSANLEEIGGISERQSPADGSNVDVSHLNENDSNTHAGTSSPDQSNLQSGEMRGMQQLPRKMVAP
jgi:hypothetical protein